MNDRRPLFKSAMLIAAALLAACGERRREDTTDHAVGGGPAASNSLMEAIPLPKPPLDRAALLEAAWRAASAYATGADDRAAQRELDGRKFELAIRFGCDGAGGNDEPLRWSVDEGRTKIEIHAVPDLKLDAAALGSSDREAVEAVEGFWIPTPWILDDRCPAVDCPTVTAKAASPTGDAHDARARAGDRNGVGIAQFFTTKDSRVRRRSGRGYSDVHRLQPETGLPEHGIRLKIEGRLRAWPQGQVIRCANSTGQRPSCILSARIDRVAFERPEDSEIIAEWEN